MAIEKHYKEIYKIYKDGIYDGHKVGILYYVHADGASNKDEKKKRLLEDYPISKGYVLVKDKTMDF